MPFVYAVNSKVVAENFTTSGTANTPIDACFIKPGSTRVVNLIGLRIQGKAAGATSLSGISARIGIWPTTASSAGTAITPSPTDDRAPAAVATAGAASAGVTSGTGTTAWRGGVGCGISGPGGWAAQNPDAGVALDGGATKSIDFFVASAATSLGYEFFSEIQE